MAHRNANNLQAEELRLVALFGTATGVLLSLASARSVAPGVEDSNVHVSLLDRAAPSVKRQILRAATGGFRPSLEMKENVDFLLTPALLVQEVMSGEVVITYPSE